MARYPSGRRGLFLHVSIVVLVAIAVPLWILQTEHSHAGHRSASRQSPALTIHAPALLNPGKTPAVSTTDSTATATGTPAASPTMTPTPTPEPSAEPATATPAASPADPDATSTPEPTPADDATASPDAALSSPAAPAPALYARTVAPASIRTAPGTDALITHSLPPGTTVQVIGCASACSWLLVQPGGGWSAAFFYSVPSSRLQFTGH